MGGKTVAYFYDPDVGNFHYGKIIFISLYLTSKLAMIYPAELLEMFIFCSHLPLESSGEIPDL